MHLWTLFQTKICDGSPQRRTYNRNKTAQRASFCICLKASYTLEAAVVIPILAGYVVTMLFFFQILQVQYDVEEALLYAGRKAAVESSIIDSDVAVLLSAEAFLLHALDGNEKVERFVKHGKWGVRIEESYVTDEMIELRASYELALPLAFFGFEKIELNSRNSFRKWNYAQLKSDDGEWVYITPSGEVYHATTECRVLKLSIQAVPIGQIEEKRGANGQKYSECKVCAWENSGEGTVYCTNYGVLYHKNVSCVFLKRTIEKVTLEEAVERRPCKYCYQE